MVIAMIGSDQLVRGGERRTEATLSHSHVTFDVLDDHDRIVDHQTYRQNDREQGEQVQREPQHLDEEDRADERQGDRGNRHENRTKRAEKEKDDDHDGEDRLEQGLRHVANRAVDVPRRVVGDRRRPCR